MVSKLNDEDLFYENQIAETNMLGNALISGIISDKINENKKKIAHKIFEMGDLNLYKTQIDRLRSLKIINVHKILKANEETGLTVHIKAAEQLLAKIEEILNDYVKIDAKGVICKDELEQLNNNISIIHSLKDKFIDIPDTASSKIQKVEEFSSDLKEIVDYIDSTSIKLNESHINLIKEASEVMGNS